MDTSLQLVILELLKDSAVQLGFLFGTLLLLLLKVKAQPSKLAFVFILLPIPLYFLEFFLPGFAWIFNFYNPLLMLVLLLDGFLLSVPAKAFNFGRAMTQKFSLIQANMVMLTLINNSHQTVEGVVRDHIPDGLQVSDDPEYAVEQLVVLPAYGSTTVQYVLTPMTRGCYEFGWAHFRYKSKLGLLWITLKGGRQDSIKVYPDLRRIRKLRVKYSRGLSAGELQKRHLGWEGTQFSGLRSYYVGDDIRKMAWQASAKLDMPVVRTFDHEVEQPILVLLDAGRKMEGRINGLSKFDWALNSALSFISVAIDRGDCVGVGVFSNQVITHYPIASGKAHLNHMLEALSQIQPQSTEPYYETVMMQFARSLKRRSLVVVFTDLIDPMASRSLLKSLKSFSTNHVLMVVTLSDSHTGEVSRKYPTTAYEAYERGVAMELLSLRQKSRLELSKSRQAMVIDAAPSQLDEALIQAYLSLKQRNQI